MVTFVLIVSTGVIAMIDVLKLVANGGIEKVIPLLAPPSKDTQFAPMNLKTVKLFMAG